MTLLVRGRQGGSKGEGEAKACKVAWTSKVRVREEGREGKQGQGKGGLLKEGKTRVVSMLAGPQLNY